MSIDLSQFYEVFFEESFEGLDIMESELLALTPGDVDSETLNTIFRAAHSIKGGSGTFGFNVIADFTHELETLLDQIREGQRILETYHVDLFLRSIDCLRDMLNALKAEDEPDTSQSSEITKKFLAILSGTNPEAQSGSDSSPATSSATADTTPSQSSDNEPSDNTASDGKKEWKIFFKPEAHLFKTGNEPIFMIQELADFGEVSIEAFTDKLPLFHDLIADDSYLFWNISLVSDNATQDKIEEIFEWVIDDAELVITAPQEQEAPADEVVEGVDFGLFDEMMPEALEQQAQAEQPAQPAPPTPKPPAAIEAKEGPAAKENKKSTEATSIRVSIEKVDTLINMVGELVITQAMLSQYGEGEFTENRRMLMQEGLAQLAHHTRELQESVMQIRMLPISFVFSRFPRLVRDISQKLGKIVELKLLGEGTELDKTVMEKISDPMVHLIRNSLDHGLETPDKRVAMGKPESGTVTLNAFHQGGNIVIEIIDDGSGIDHNVIGGKAIEKGLIEVDNDLTEQEIVDLIFLPGFSTKAEVTDLSGRGVGMDVVRRNIQELNGTVEVASTINKGSTFTIRLPLTLAILDGQLVTVGNNTYIIPLVNIIESIQMTPKQINNVGGDLELFRQREEYIPIVRLHQVLDHEDAIESLTEGILVIVESDNGHIGLLVDDLLAQQQVVIKSLEANYQRVEGISGATILGDGTISLIIDIGGIVNLAGLRKLHKNKMNQLNQQQMMA
ncbi:MAG: two-component system chemotaxis sensor kinase CheA [Phenylobacterium sp.]|jgi:two-component system chemotaxis sensor kinase CheA